MSFYKQFIIFFELMMRFVFNILICSAENSG